MKTMKVFWVLCLALLVMVNLSAQEPESIPEPAPEPVSEPEPEQAIDETMAQLYEKVDPAVVAIQHERAGGSGSIVSPDGYIITNGHVVQGNISEEGDPKVTAKRITVILSNEKKYQAKVIGHCLDPDVALIKIEVEEELPVVKLGDSDEVKTGYKSFAYGMPHGMKRTMTAGIVSNAERTDLGTFTKVFQTDSLISPGNSGGPLFNERGEVIGINTYGGTGHGFTIPVNVVKVLKEHFLKYGHFRRAMIPFFTTKPLYEEYAQAVSLDKGVLVDYVEPDSAAAEASLATGDIIIEMNGDAVEAHTEAANRDFIWDLVIQEVGTEVEFKILRPRAGKDPQEYLITAKLVKDEPAVEYGYQIGEIKEMRYDALGLGVKKMTKATYYLHRMPKPKGIRITRILRNSPAAKAGLGRGYLITALDDINITEIEQFKKELETRLIKKQKHILFTVLKGGGRNLTAPEARVALKPFYDLDGKKVVVVLPPEDMEYFELIRTFFITNGARIFTASNVRSITLDENRIIKPDKRLSDINVSDFDGIVFVGGAGARVYWEDKLVHELVRTAVKEKKVLGAIGAASITLVNAEVSLLEKKITSDPEYSIILVQKKANYTEKEVEQDGNIITTTGFDAKVMKSFLNKFKTVLFNSEGEKE